MFFNPFHWFSIAFQNNLKAISSPIWCIFKYIFCFTLWFHFNTLFNLCLSLFVLKLVSFLSMTKINLQYIPQNILFLCSNNFQNMHFIDLYFQLFYSLLRYKNSYSNIKCTCTTSAPSCEIHWVQYMNSEAHCNQCLSHSVFCLVYLCSQQIFMYIMRIIMINCVSILHFIKHHLCPPETGHLGRKIKFTCK